MVKRITTDDRRKIAKIANRLAKEWKWREIAADLGFPTPQAAHSWFAIRAIKIDGKYIPVDQITA